MTILVNQNVKQTDTKGLICVTLEIHLWSGRKRLKKAQLLAKNPEFAKLPPESLATLGSIKVCDTDDLAPFLSLKRRAEKVLAENGLPILGTIGIPDDKLDSVFAVLMLIKAEFDAKASAFHARYDAAIDMWRRQPENASWSHLIDDIPTAEQVAGRLSFAEPHLCRVSAPSAVEGSPANGGYLKQMTGLKGELFSDAAKEAEVLIVKYLTGTDANGVTQRREKVTWKTLRPLKRIGEKFSNFAFLDPTVEPLAKMIDHVLKLLPTDGPIDGLHLMHVWSLSQTLANPGKAMEIARVAFDTNSSSAAFQHLLTVKTSPEQASFQPQVAMPALQEVKDVSVSTVTPTEAVANDRLFDIPDVKETSHFVAPEQQTYVGLF